MNLSQAPISNRKVLLQVGLAIYAVILFLFMTFYRLPGDRLVGALAGRVTKGQLAFSAEKVFSSFPPGYRFEGAAYGLSLPDRVTRDRLDSLAIQPDYGRLFLGYLPFRFRGIMSQGAVAGETGISMLRGSKMGYIAVKASDVALENFSILRSLTGRYVKGKLNADFKIRGNLVDPSEVNGEGRFSVENGTIDTRLDITGLKTVPFQSIKSSFTIRNGVVTLSNTEMDGPMFAGSLSGEIRLQKELAGSLLNLAAKMRPGPLLENNPLASQFMAKLRKGKDPLVLKLEGTLNRPSFTWGKV